jgi:hypothetical protein
MRRGVAPILTTWVIQQGLARSKESRIQIRMFMGLPDPAPAPLVRGMDPDPSLFSSR